jgi:hypothetical protein
MGKVLKQMPEFELWLEFEHGVPLYDYDPEDDFCNTMITLEDGTK